MIEIVTSVWRSHKAKLALSIFCVAVASFDTFWKTLSPVAAGALAVAIVPWMLGIIERISAPGGFEVVLAKAERQLDASGTAPDEDDLNAFKYFEGSDPNLAIAMLRVQVERRLREIAEEVMLSPNTRGGVPTLRHLTEDLAKEGAIPKEAAVLLNNLMPVMNAAVHGVELQPNASDFALTYGPKILAMLKTQKD
ncbi:hypothetical protein [Pikeienuella sp. HZG-20]|uniref:hypothetical protein n=1 Tax=Paludibacillus litoralis TaxID=3133267 RepID=UPI0030EBBD9F